MQPKGYLKCFAASVPDNVVERIYAFKQPHRSEPHIMRLSGPSKTNPHLLRLKNTKGELKYTPKAVLS